MNNQDNQLDRLLHQWREIEPLTNFDAQVWRRIEVGMTRRGVRPSSFADWLRSLLPRPVFALTAATVAGVVIGVSSGVISASAPRATEQLSFLSPNTLAGALGR